MKEHARLRGGGGGFDAEIHQDSNSDHFQKLKIRHKKKKKTKPNSEELASVTTRLAETDGGKNNRGKG